MIASEKKCLDAFKAMLEDDNLENLQDDMFRHVGSTAVELLQLEPILIQKEYYTGGGDGMIREEEDCRDADGRFDAWNGTIDCIGIGSNNQGSKFTKVIENAATCFPPGDACRIYTMEKWRLETNIAKASYSCTIRGKTQDGNDDEGQEKSKDHNNESNDGDDEEEQDSGEDEKVLPGGLTASSSNMDEEQETNHLPFMVVVTGLGLLASIILISLGHIRSKTAARRMVNANDGALELVETTAEMT